MLPLDSIAATTVANGLRASTVQVSSGRRGALWTLLLSGIPGACVLVAHSIANKILTGSSTAAGALVKLEMYHPYMTSQEIWDAWLFHLRYQVLRVTHYHFSDVAWTGWIVWLFAASSLLFKQTLRQAHTRVPLPDPWSDRSPSGPPPLLP